MMKRRAISLLKNLDILLVGNPKLYVVVKLIFQDGFNDRFSCEYLKVKFEKSYLKFYSCDESWIQDQDKTISATDGQYNTNVCF